MPLTPSSCRWPGGADRYFPVSFYKFYKFSFFFYIILYSFM